MLKEFETSGNRSNSKGWQKSTSFFAVDVPYMGRSPESEVLNPQEGWKLISAVTEYGPGCPARCIYCNQQAFEVDEETQEKKTPYISLMVDAGISLNTRLMSGPETVSSISPADLVRELTSFEPYYPESSLMIENFNDPGVSWKKTIELIKELIKVGHLGPIIFLTKFGISESSLEALVQCQRDGAKIIAGVTYSGLPEEIEPIGSGARLKGLERFKQSGIPTIVSMRPIIKGINDSDDHLRYILEQAGSWADVITAGGLFVYDNFTHRVFEQAGHPLDTDYYPKDAYRSAKIIDPDLKSRVRELAKQLNIETPVMDHFSCSTALLMSQKYGIKLPDRMARWANPYGQLQKDCGNCPSEQRLICYAKSQEKPHNIITKAKEMASRLGYPDIDISPSSKIPGLLVVKNGLLAINELFAIESYCGWDINNLPTREVFLEEAAQIIQDELSLNLSDFLIEIQMINQDWFVYTTGLSARLQDLALKHLRGKLRCRIQLINN